MQCPQKWILLVVVYVPDDPRLAFCLVHILDDVKIDADFQVLLLDIVSYLSVSNVLVKDFFSHLGWIFAVEKLHLLLLLGRYFSNKFLVAVLLQNLNYHRK